LRVSEYSPLIPLLVTRVTRDLVILDRANPLKLQMGVPMNQSENNQIQPDFESRLRFGLHEVLNERPELREVLPLAALMDDALRWCA
jgi:hypothetical protein